MPEHNPIVRAQSKPKSLRAAIDAMCAACMGCTIEMIEPGFRNEIRNCTSHHCPLWTHRPYQRGSQEGRRSDLETTLADEVVQTPESTPERGFALSGLPNERNPQLRQKHGGFDIPNVKPGGDHGWSQRGFTIRSI